MSNPLGPQDERELVDQIALIFEHAGYPPVMGRILAFLLICDPPEQSSQQLADYLHASKGAISQSTRMLMHAGLVERVRVRGSRAAWFRISPGAWKRAIADEVARVRRLKEMAAAGLMLLADAPDERKARLREFHDVNAFFEEEFPRILERLDQKTRGRTT